MTTTISSSEPTVKINTNISRIQEKYWDFLWNNFPGTIISSINKFKTLIQEILESSDKSVITISSFSWRWKSTFVDDLTELNSFILPPKENPIVFYNNWFSIEKKWYNHDDISVFHAEADWFLWMIWKERTWKMIESYEKFEEHYWDEELAIDTIKKFLNHNEYLTVNWVYWKTDEERKEEKKLSSITFASKPVENKKLVILDWTNSHEIWKKIQDEQNESWIKILNILLDPCPEDLLCEY